MGADIINLRQTRKTKARADKEARASQNRTQFGRTKAEKRLAKSAIDRANRHMNGHELNVHDAGDGPADTNDTD